MKKILLLLTIFTFVTKGFSQVTETSVLSKDDYLKKATNQKTAAWISLGGGAAMILGSMAINVHQGWGEGNQNKGLWLAYLGGATTLASIPLFICAHQNKLKAATLTFSNQPIYFPLQNSWVKKTQPAIQLTIPVSSFGRKQIHCK